MSLEEARREVNAGVTASDPAARAEQQTRAGIAALVSHPKGWIEETVAGAIRLLVGPGLADWKQSFGIDSPLASIPGYAISLAIFVLAVAGSGFAIRERRWLLLAVGSVAAYVVLVSSGGEAYSRMRVPIEPLLAILASFGVGRIAGLASQSVKRSNPPR